MSNHKEFTLANDIQVYFCDPKSPWQRGSNENTNRLFANTSLKEKTLMSIPSKIESSCETTKRNDS